jgi:hypothetical protein
MVVIGCFSLAVEAGYELSGGFLRAGSEGLGF